jgi:predicted nucleic acid-binding Zn ribbon protein
MSRCLNCEKRMQYRRDFCSENCSQEWFEKQEIAVVEEDESEDESDDN